jgi:2,5-diketo-D-gluconate reductase B
MIFVDMRGREVPALGFGTWQLTGSTCVRMVETALELGYRHLDTAQVYGNETEVGRAVAQSGLKRADVFITTKVSQGSLRASEVRSSVAQSLERLQTPYVDLLLIHWPNERVPLAETLGAMQELKSVGKAKAIGVSNFPVRLMQEAVSIAGGEIACNQVEYHLMLSQAPVLDFAQRHHIAVTAYCPLARGRLFGHKVAEQVARRHGKTVSQVGLRWLIEQKGVMAIPKTSSERHARENFAIFDFSLDAEDHQLLDALPGAGRVVSPSFAPRWDG